MTAFGPFDESYPPEILHGYVPPVPATGATAGTPGTYTPTGAITPADLADLADVTATPLTAWAPGEYVPLGDGTAARWDGAAWVTIVPAQALRPGATDEGDEMTDPTEPTTAPPDPGPESNAPEGAVPVDSTRTEPDGPAVVAVPVEQLDEAAAAAEPTPTVRAPSVRESEPIGDELVDQPDADTVLEGAGEDDAHNRDVTDEALEVSNSGQLTVHEGTPGRYEPEVAPKERPRTIAELRSRCQPAEPASWVEGSYVLIGTTGKRAHWSGDDWRGDESPGYPDADQ